MGQRRAGVVLGRGLSTDRIGALGALYALNLRAFWERLTKQPASFWFVCLYVFFEYVRPQQIYPAMGTLPYSKFIIGLAAFSFVLEGRSIRFGLMEAFLTVFTLIVVISSFTAVFPDQSFANLMDYVSWVIVYLLISNAVDTEERFVIFTMLFLLYSFKMAQSATRSWASDGFAYRDWGAAGAPGWFGNSGELAIQMGVFFSLTIAVANGLRNRWTRVKRLGWWAVVASAAISIVACSSRGGELAGAGVVLWLIVKSRRRVRGLLGAAALGVLVWLILPAEQINRFRSAGDDKTSLARKTYWHEGLEMLRNHPTFGIGYANWKHYHAVVYGFPALPHNIFIEAAAQLGYAGLLGFVALIICNLVINARTRKLVKPLGERGRFMYEMAHGLDGSLIAFLIGGFFVTVLFYPFFWINLAMSAALNRAAIDRVSHAPRMPGAHTRPDRRRGFRTVGPVATRPVQVSRPVHQGAR